MSRKLSLYYESSEVVILWSEGETDGLQLNLRCIETLLSFVVMEYNGALRESFFIDFPVSKSNDSI